MGNKRKHQNGVRKIVCEVLECSESTVSNIWAGERKAQYSEDTVNMVEAMSKYVDRLISESKIDVLTKAKEYAQIIEQKQDAKK